jgi:hypothetical protein
VDDPMNARSGCGRLLEHPDAAGSAGTWRFARWWHRAMVPEDAYGCPPERGRPHHQAKVNAQADVRERVDLPRRLDGFSWEESPPVASSCLRSFQMVSSFARGAVRESLEAVRVAVWRRGGWRLIATGKMISS